MPRFSLLQTVTVLLLFGSCMYVANVVSKYLLKEDGGYGQWSVFTSCSKSCDGGVRIRKRICNNPVPRYGGSNCSILGPPVQVFACNRQPCPINGAYGRWGEFGQCSVSCGGGTQERVRKCDNPAPQHGGKNCQEMELGPDHETKTCNEQICPVNGGYSIWSDFNECSRSCGGGVKIRSRTCTNPEPSGGGKDCNELGPSSETESCNTKSCVTTPPTTEPTTSPPTTIPLTTPQHLESGNVTKSTVKPKENVTAKPNAAKEESAETNTTTTTEPSPTGRVTTTLATEAITDPPTNTTEQTQTNQATPKSS